VWLDEVIFGMLKLGEVSFGILKLGVEILLWTLFVPKTPYFCTLYGQEISKKNLNIGSNTVVVCSRIPSLKGDNPNQL